MSLTVSLGVGCCRLNANEMDRALSGYEMLVHVAKHSDAIITYADTLTVRDASCLLFPCPVIAMSGHTTMHIACLLSKIVGSSHQSSRTFTQKGGDLFSL